MATRDVSVRLSANTTQYTTAISKASAVTKGFAADSGKAFDSATSHIQKHQAAYNEVGDSMLKLGAVGAVGLAAVGKAAMDWESQWAGVTKTVDGSTAQLSTLEDQLRDMAKTMPATHEEIAAVAEAAGQLGVRTDDVAGFTKTMIDLGETTNLTAEEAATSLAQFMNVMGTSADDVDNLGAAIVDLGNNGASTEKDIVMMAQRIAGAGAQVGLAETDVLAISSALASVGINAEAGGTAVSTSLLKIDAAVRESGDQLDVLAETAGMTSEEFRAAWQDDAAGALDSFILGLGDVQEQGGDTNAILKELGITGIREGDAIRRLAGTHGLLTENLELSKEAWKENTALAEEAAKRYETTESQIKIAWNTIKDSAIDAGGAILPVVADLAAAAADLAAWFGDLPDGMQGFLVKAAAVTTAALLLSGGLIKGATGAASLIGSLKEIQSSSPAVASALGKVGATAGAVAGAAVAIVAIGAAAEALDKSQVVGNLEQLNSIMLQTASSAGHLDAAFVRTNQDGSIDELVGGVSDLDSAFRRVFDRAAGEHVADFAEGIISGVTPLTSQLDETKQQFDKIDESLSALVMSGATDQAAAAFANITEAARKQGVTNQQLVETFPAYIDTLRKTANELGITTLSVQDYVDWAGGKVPPAVLAAQKANEKGEKSIEGVGGAAQDATEDIEALITAMFDMANQALASSNAEIAFEQAIDDATKAAKDNKKSLDTNTQAGRDNRSELNRLASASIDLTQEQIRQGDSTKDVTGTMERARKKFIETAREMGATKKEARQLADEYGLIPDDVKTNVSAPGAKKTKGEIDDVDEAMRKIEDREVDMSFNVLAGGEAIKFAGGKIVTPGGMATGGPVFGPGTATSDSIPTWLSNGEYVINAKQTAKFRTLLEAINQDRMPGFRDGGLVSRDVVVNSNIDRAAVDGAIHLLRSSGDLIGDAVVKHLQGAVDVGGPGGGIRMGSNGLVQWRGGTFTENFARHLQAAYAMAPFSVFQGGWNPGGVAASGTSHDKDAVDATPSYAALAAMKKNGIAAWMRGPAQGFIWHIHGVPLPGSGIGSASAQWQAQDYLRGGIGLATGGPVYGPGSATSDSIPARLSNGEYVINAASTAMFRPLLDEINRTPKYGFMRGSNRYANGGPVEVGPAGGGDVAAAVRRELQGMHMRAEINDGYLDVWFDGRYRHNEKQKAGRV